MTFLRPPGRRAARSRVALTLIEMSISAVTMLILLAILTGILVFHRRQDAWTAGRLDGVGAAGRLLDALWTDAAQADLSTPQAVSQQGESLAIPIGGEGPLEPPGRAEYSVDGDRRLLRNGRRLALAHVARLEAQPAAGEARSLVHVLFDAEGRTEGRQGRPVQVRASILFGSSSSRAVYQPWRDAREETPPPDGPVL